MYSVKNLIDNTENKGVSFLFISEGYTSIQEQMFYDDIFHIYKRILEYECFSKLKFRNNTVSVFSLFKPSSNFGSAASISSAINNTAFETYFDSSGLHINYSLFENIINNTTIIFNNTEYNLINLFRRSNRGLVNNGEIFVPIVIFPSTFSLNGELENIQDNELYFVASSIGNFPEQVAIRALAKLIGLGDEYDWEGNDFEICPNNYGKFINANYPNLLYDQDIVNNNISNNFKWINLLPQSYNALPIHLHPNAGLTADRDFPLIPLSYKKIELWEGGGFFRKNVFRPAKDCLQRRKIGETALPVKEQKVSLCPLCFFYINKYI